MYGRTKFDPALGIRIAALVKLGVPTNRAARMCGVHVATFNAWMEKGAKFQETGLFKLRPYFAFMNLIEEAEAECEARLAIEVRTGMKHEKKDGETVQTPLLDTTNQKWMLERRFKENWGREARQATAKVEGSTDSSGKAVIKAVICLPAEEDDSEG